MKNKLSLNKETAFPLLVQLLILLFIFLPSIFFLVSVHMLNWWLLLGFFLLQFFFNQLYFLFTKHETLNFTINGLFFIGVEIAILLLLFFMRHQLDSLANILLFIEWFCVHLTLIARPLFIEISLLTFTVQLTLAQNVFEYTQANLFLTKANPVMLLLNIALVCLLASLYITNQERNIRPRLLFFSLITLVLSIVLTIFWRPNSFWIFGIVIAILFLILFMQLIYKKIFITKN